jgi:UDP-glucose 6-dehydrogenase
VVGTSDERARRVLGDVYRPLSLNQAPLMFTARRTAELIKYAANAFLATKITFINEIADLSEKVGADVQEVARGSGSTTASARNSCMRGRLRRLVLPEGYPGADQNRARS